jgi:hypothetical protein
VRPLPRYVLAIMAAFVAFELWIPLLALLLRALGGPTVPTAIQVIGSLFGLAVPTLVGLALSDYLADRQGLVRPYQPKRRPAVQEDREDGATDDEDDGRDGGADETLGREDQGLGREEAPASERDLAPTAEADALDTGSEAADPERTLREAEGRPAEHGELNGHAATGEARDDHAAPAGRRGARRQRRR